MSDTHNFNTIHAVNPRMNYYLLDWKDSHIEEFVEMFGNKSIRDLTHDEYAILFKHVTEYDIKNYLTK